MKMFSSSAKTINFLVGNSSKQIDSATSISNYLICIKATADKIHLDDKGLDCRDLDDKDLVSAADSLLAAAVSIAGDVMSYDITLGILSSVNMSLHLLHVKLFQHKSNANAFNEEKRKDWNEYIANLKREIKSHSLQKFRNICQSTLLFLVCKIEWAIVALPT